MQRTVYCGSHRHFRGFRFGQVITCTFESAERRRLEPSRPRVVLRKILRPQPQQSAYEQNPAGDVPLATNPRTRYVCAVHHSCTRSWPGARGNASRARFHARDATEFLGLLAGLTRPHLLGRGQAAPDQRSDRFICGRGYLLMPAPSVDGCEHLAIKSYEFL